MVREGGPFTRVLLRCRHEPQHDETAMSVYSMTGYASAQGTLPATPNSPEQQLRLELRSVNNRFLDFTLRLPEVLSSNEPAVRERVSKQLRRGKVELRVHLDKSQSSAVAAPSPDALRQLADVQDAIRALLPQASPLSVSQVLQLNAASVATSDEANAVFLSTLDQGLVALKAARAREGERLCAMLLDRCQALRALAEQAAPMIPTLVEQQRQRFLDKFNTALQDAGGLSSSTAQERALAEATAYAIRIDVAEELTRLASHLDEISQLLAKGGELGKRLDFLIQELHREANTLGSKSSTLELTRISVDMKVLVEQMREQVQNIE